MRYGFATIALPTLTPAEAAEHLSRAGFGGIEFALGTAPHAAGSSAERFLVGNRCVLPLDEGAVVRAAGDARSQGLEVIGVTPYVTSGDVAGLDRAMSLSVAAGAGQVRLQPPRREPGAAKRQRIEFAAFLGAAVPLARRHGVAVAVELHQATIAPSVGLLLPLLEALDPELIGVIYDVGNLVVEGYENHALALELLGSRLHHVHLKDADVLRRPDGRRSVRWAGLGRGIADVGGLLALLHERGYVRWLSIEDLSDGRDSAATIRANAGALTRLHAPGWHGAVPDEGTSSDVA